MGPSVSVVPAFHPRNFQPNVVVRPHGVTVSSRHDRAVTDIRRVATVGRMSNAARRLWPVSLAVLVTACIDTQDAVPPGAPDGSDPVALTLAAGLDPEELVFLHDL